MFAWTNKALAASSKSIGNQSVEAKTKKLVTRPLPKPDLVPTRIWVDPSNCRLWVEWENRGGPATEKTFSERYSLKGRFFHGAAAMTSYTFDSANKYAIPSPYKLNHEVTDLYGLFIDGSTSVKFSFDATNVYSEKDETNNTMKVDVECKKRPLFSPRKN